MAILLTGADSYAQFITVLVVFILVLAVTAYATKWMANYQKKQGMNCNIEIVETARLGNNKWIQIVRVGDTYKVLAICKDTVTSLGEVSKEQLKEIEPESGSLSFKELLDKAVKRDSSDHNEPRDKNT